MSELFSEFPHQREQGMRRLLATALVAFSAAGSASAQFIASDGAFGSDSLVTDTISGTTWLNLDATMGLSLSAVRTNLESDPLYADFRFATSSEISGLFGDAGFCVGDVTCNAITDRRALLPRLRLPAHSVMMARASTWAT